VWARPSFEPLPEPAAPNSADYTAMQTLAAELLPADDTAMDQAGLDLLVISAATDNGESGMASLGLDLAAGATELDAMIAEAELDTLVNEVATAVQQDTALGTAGLGVDQSWPV
jgi:hypothetical protein